MIEGGDAGPRTSTTSEYNSNDKIDSLPSIDPDALAEIKRAAAVLLGPGQITEVRTFPPGPTLSGFFDNVDELADKVAALAADPTVSGLYWTINPARPDMLDHRRDGLPRAPNRIGPADSGESVGNADIIGRRWLYIDLDPERETGTAATDAEKGAAVERATAIADHLAAQGWPSPVVVDSGNGRHLYYRVDLPVDSALVRDCLKALKARFSDDAVKVDLAVSNAGRIARIPGTWNRKGPNTTDRPHRPTTLITVPDELVIVPDEMLQTLADEIPRATRSTTGTTRTATAATGITAGDGFDLVEWLGRHADRLKELGFIIEPSSNPEYRHIARVRPCPFDPSHDDDGGSFIGQTKDGGLFARCHHDRCGGAGDDAPNRWGEFRQMVEPTGSIANRDGLALDVIRRKRKIARLAELDDLLSAIDAADALADDLRTVGALVWLNFDDDAIADIMQRCRPSAVPRRPDYLRKTIDKARGENGTIYDPGRYVFPERRAEITKATPPGIAESVRIGGIRYATAGPIDAETDAADYLRSIALYLVDRKKASGEIAASVARKNDRLPEGRRLDAAGLATVIETAERDYIAARRRALAAAVVPDRDPEPEPDPVAAVDDVPPEIRAKANDALRAADPFSFIAATFGTVHSGDREVAEVMTVAVGAQSCIGTMGIQPAIAGPMGTGKTAAAKAFVHLLPQDFVFKGSFSGMAFFRHLTRPGTVVFSDDTELRPEINDLLKRATSNFQEETPHYTLDLNREAITVFIPPRPVFLFTAISDQGDEQFGDRQFKISIVTDADADKKYVEFLAKRAAAGIPDYPVTEQVLICREMFRQVKERLFNVEVPFMPYITFTDMSGRRTMRGLLDFIMGVTVIRFMQRTQYRHDDDPEGVIRLVATVADYETAKRIYGTNAETKKHALTRDERALWEYIWKYGRDIAGGSLGSTVKGMYESEIIERYARADSGKKRDGTRTAVRRLLYGRIDRGIPGGITAKVPGCYRTDDHVEPGAKRPKKGLIVCTMGPKLSDYEAFCTLDADGWAKDPKFKPE